MRHPPLTERAFHRLLAWLDGGVGSQGDTYLEIRRRLIAYFDRRSCASPEALTDETFNRIGATLERSGAIAVTPPAPYYCVVARLVFLEDIRWRESAHVSAAVTIEPLVATSRQGNGSDALVIGERRSECLDRCMKALDAPQHDLIVEYYGCAGPKKIATRRELARRLGITVAVALTASGT